MKYIDNPPEGTIMEGEYPDPSKRVDQAPKKGSTYYPIKDNPNNIDYTNTTRYPKNYSSKNYQ